MKKRLIEKSEAKAKVKFDGIVDIVDSYHAKIKTKHGADVPMRIGIVGLPHLGKYELALRLSEVLPLWEAPQERFNVINLDLTASKVCVRRDETKVLMLDVPKVIHHMSDNKHILFSSSARDVGALAPMVDLILTPLIVRVYDVKEKWANPMEPFGYLSAFCGRDNDWIMNYVLLQSRRYVNDFDCPVVAVSMLPEVPAEGSVRKSRISNELVYRSPSRHTEATLDNQNLDKDTR